MMKSRVRGGIFLSFWTGLGVNFALFSATAVPVRRSRREGYRADRAAGVHRRGLARMRPLLAAPGQASGTKYGYARGMRHSSDKEEGRLDAFGSENIEDPASKVSTTSRSASRRLSSYCIVQRERAPLERPLRRGFCRRVGFANAFSCVGGARPPTERAHPIA
jgi:hypothetical protein